MALLNYTTEIPASRSIAEITRMLTEGGASAIMLENGPDKEIVAVSFMMDTSFGVRVPFQLPANVPQVIATINKQIADETKRVNQRSNYKRKIPRSLYNDKAQAERIAWRIAKDWLEAQMALAEIGASKFEQIMMPFAQIGGRSFYDHVVQRGSLALMPAEQKAEPIPVEQV